MGLSGPHAAIDQRFGHILPHCRATAPRTDWRFVTPAATPASLDNLDPQPLLFPRQLLAHCQSRLVASPFVIGGLCGVSQCGPKFIEPSHTAPHTATSYTAEQTHQPRNALTAIITTANHWSLVIFFLVIVLRVESNRKHALRPAPT
jgi:hypothetical protein